VSVDTIGALFIAIYVFGPVANEELGIEKESFGAALIWPSVSVRALVEFGAIGLMGMNAISTSRRFKSRTKQTKNKK